MTNKIHNNNQIIQTLLPFMLVAGFSTAMPAIAHHSFAKFQLDRTIEIEGELIEVRWQNPHVEFMLRGTDANGQEQIWQLETASPGILRRSGLSKELVAVGDRVKVAGNPTVNGALELNAHNMLMPSGQELLLGPRVQLRFTDRAITSNDDIWNITEGDTSFPELGLFRVWSSTIASALTLFPDQSRPDITVLDYPLTATARRAVEAFDAVEGSRQLASDCAPKPMPWVMEQPYDLMFEQSGNDIMLKLEEFDTVRTIHMDWRGDRLAQPDSPLGFSTGTWEGTTLVVTTTNLNSPNFKFEIPASNQASIMERFTPSTAGDRLDYEIVVTDPQVFTEPVSLEKFWISIPSQAFDKYNCGQLL